MFGFVILVKVIEGDVRRVRVVGEVIWEILGIWFGILVFFGVEIVGVFLLRCLGVFGLIESCVF